MKYEMKSNKIIVHGLEDFKISQILECGQIFRYKKLDENTYIVYYGKNFAKITEFIVYE